MLETVSSDQWYRDRTPFTLGVSGPELGASCSFQGTESYLPLRLKKEFWLKT